MVERDVHSVKTEGKWRYYPIWKDRLNGKWNSYSDHRGHTVWFATRSAADQWLKELERTLRGN